MDRDRASESAAAPPWLLAVPLLVLALIWYMSRATPVSRSTTRKPVKQIAPATAAAKSTTKPATPALPPPVASSAPPLPWVTPKKGQPFEPLFLAATKLYGLPPGLLSRVAARESYYNPAAGSRVGALGIMQIMPKYHPDLDPGELALDKAAALDPKRAIPYAAKYLRQLYRQFGKWTLAVAAYNAGPTAVTKYRGVPPFAETRAYVAAILPRVGIAQPEPGVLYA